MQAFVRPDSCRRGQAIPMHLFRAPRGVGNKILFTIYNGLVRAWSQVGMALKLILFHSLSFLGFVCLRWLDGVFEIETTMRRYCMSNSLRFLQITAEHQHCPFFTLFLTIKTLSQNISIMVLQISLKLHEHRDGCWRKKLP